MIAIAIPSGRRKAHSLAIAKPLIGGEEKRAVLRILNSGVLSQGKEVKSFEEKFADYIGVKYAVAASNGTTALHASLLASGIKPGDEVITTPFSFIATANSILYCGARPVFADIDHRTFNISPDSIREKISKRTKAVLVVHLYGQPCEMDEILETCEENDLLLVEDACQAHGAEYKGKKAGSIGDCAAFSFYPTKNMTTGEGGMITTNSKEIADRAKLIREHGSKERYLHTALGYNYRMTDISAAIGLVQLKKLDAMNRKRAKNAKMLTESLENIHGIVLPYASPDAKHVFHQYTIRVENFKLSRDKLAAELNRRGIGTGIYYPAPIYRQPFYRSLGYREKLPDAEKAANEVLSLPVHPSVSNKDIAFVASQMKALA